ncbi:cytochrome P450 [Conidiobolus coronatus NRRL 28638]|uniref:Cytochrome P450 n=1 Tax=Conidiobolus coronatus (strain ATCC 28846 / CBS 209.66 / NRRL 28638) TaxID=796925 RepID=A0A137NUW6_CONC2|nr:cytochrome P450 [Conidiobolus coronatus NRRL 28638]|eukprot:KXN66522.1 cytochrome P450 [Conidiobolus coronatus NRRL 28638]
MFLNIILIPIAYIAYRVYQWGKCPSELKDLPSIGLIEFIKSIVSKGSYPDKFKLIQEKLNEHGIIRIFHISYGWSVMIGNPKLAKEVSSKDNIFPKHDIKKEVLSPHLKRFLGLSQVLGSVGDEWKRHRKVVNPIFNQSWDTKWKKQCNNSEVNIQDKIQRMTLDVFGKAIFDYDFKAVKEQDSELYNLYVSIFDGTFNPLYSVFPFLDNLPYFKRPEVSKKLDAYHEFIEGIIKLKEKEIVEGKENNSKNLVSSLIQSNIKLGDDKLSNDEIRDDLSIFIIAGHDTTSNTLISTLYYLARYPQVQDKLRTQILGVLENPSSVVIPTTDQLKNMPYLDLVNKESMRIMSTAAQIQRICTKEHTLSNGLTIPKNTNIMLHLWGIHHNPNAFENPDEFLPERFDQLTNEESRNWQPFATGARSCIGMSFSLVEQRVTIAMLLQAFEFSISPQNPSYEKIHISTSALVKPDNLKLIIKLRE